MLTFILFFQSLVERLVFLGLIRPVDQRLNLIVLGGETMMMICALVCLRWSTLLPAGFATILRARLLATKISLATYFS